MREPRPKPLGHFLDYGIGVIGTYESGATTGSWKERKHFTTDRRIVSHWWEANVRRFQFIPAEHGLIVLDIDRKNDKDGLRELYGLFTEAPAPDYLLHPETHPAYTETPSGGLHLYFKYEGTTQYRSGEIAPGLEVVHTRHLITAPGSKKDGRPYVFYGDLNEAPAIPFTLRRHFTKYEEAPADVHRFSWEQRDFSNTPLGTMADTIERQGNYSGRNDFVYELAHWAAKTNTTAEEVIAFCRERFPDFPESEITYTVRRQYEGGL